MGTPLRHVFDLNKQKVRVISSTPVSDTLRKDFTFNIHHLFIITE